MSFCEVLIVVFLSLVDYMLCVILMMFGVIFGVVVVILMFFIGVGVE